MSVVASALLASTVVKTKVDSEYVMARVRIAVLEQRFDQRDKLEGKLPEECTRGLQRRCQCRVLDCGRIAEYVSKSRCFGVRASHPQFNLNTSTAAAA